MSPSQNVVVIDDDGTPGLLVDDFNPTFVGGDTDGDASSIGRALDVQANAAALAGEYVNIATVNGTAADDFGNTAPVEANEDDCYTGLDPTSRSSRRRTAPTTSAHTCWWARPSLGAIR